MGRLSTFIGRTSGSLRVRLLALVFVALLPALCLVIYTADDHWKHDQTAARTETLRLARLVAAEQEKTIEGARQFAIAVSGFTEILRGRSGDRRRHLADMLRTSPGYVNVAVVDRNGSLLASAVPTHLPVDVSDRDWFQKAIHTGRFAISDFQVGPATHKPTVIVCYPVKSKPGKVTALAYAALNLDWMGHLLDNASLPNGSAVVVLDRSGTVLARRPDNDRWRGYVMSGAPVFRQIRLGTEGTAVTDSLDGVRRLWASVPVHSQREVVGSVLVGVAEDIAFADAKRLRGRTVLLLFLATTAIVTSTLVFSNVAILSRIRGLAANAGLIASGDLAARTPGPRRDDELGTLECAFDDMADALQHHEESAREAEHQLRMSESRYRLLFETTPLPAVVYDSISLDILAVNETAIRAYGYTREEFTRMSFDDIHPCPDTGGPVDGRCLLRDGDDLAGLCQHARKDGSIIDVEVATHELDLSGRPARLVLVTDVTERLRTQHRLRDSVEQLRSLAQRLQTVRENERASVAREVHDELGQALTGLKMDIVWVRAHLDGDGSRPSADADERLVEMMGLVDDTIQTVRRIATELRPPVLDTLGLVAALEWQAHDFQRRMGMPCRIVSRVSDLHLGAASAAAVFRVFQEALTNIARHAQATRVYISLERKADETILRVEDNGVGIRDDRLNGTDSLGLLGMRERAAVFQGEVDVGRREEGGTRVTVRIPMEAVESGAAGGD